MTDHHIDLTKLDRAQLTTLTNDIALELAKRAETDRTALLERLRSTALEAGFDPALVKISTSKRGRPSKRKNGHDAEAHDAS